MTTPNITCGSCGQPITPTKRDDENLCFDCYMAWLRSPAGAAGLASGIENGDGSTFSELATKVLSVLVSTGRYLRVPDAEIAAILRVYANSMSGDLVVMEMIEQSKTQGSTDTLEGASAMVADLLLLRADQVAEICNALGLPADAIPVGLRDGAHRIVRDLDERYAGN